MEEYCFRSSGYEMVKGEIGIINEDVFVGDKHTRERRFRTGDFVRIVNPTYSHYVTIDENPIYGAKTLLVEKRKITPIRDIEWKRLK